MYGTKATRTLGLGLGRSPIASFRPTRHQILSGRRKISFRSTQSSPNVRSRDQAERHRVLMTAGAPSGEAGHRINGRQSNSDGLQESVLLRGEAKVECWTSTLLAWTTPNEG